MSFAVKSEYQGNRMLSHGFRRISRHTNYPDIVFRGCFEINIIETGAPQCDQFYTVSRKLLYRLPIRFVIYKKANGAMFLCQCNSRLIQRSFKVSELMMPFRINPVKVFLIVRFGIEESDFHHAKIKPE